MALKYIWVDGESEPQCAPDPNYPNGVDIDRSRRSVDTCMIDLPYPAARIGRYLIDCETCGQRTMVTTSGRSDDPRSVKLGCWSSQRERRH